MSVKLPTFKYWENDGKYPTWIENCKVGEIFHDIRAYYPKKEAYFNSLMATKREVYLKQIISSREKKNKLVGKGIIVGVKVVRTDQLQEDEIREMFGFGKDKLEAFNLKKYGITHIYAIINEVQITKVL